MSEETLDDQMMEPEVSEVLIESIYPSVSERVKAVFYDSMVMVGLMIVAALVFSYFEDAPENARMYTALFIIAIYDPLMTSLFGGTFGHMMNGIRVKRQKNEQKNIIFPLAFIRYVIKLYLGWISLLTVVSNKKNKAIHDMAVGSIVIYAKNQESN